MKPPPVTVENLFITLENVLEAGAGAGEGAGVLAAGVKEEKTLL
jgi:hypothetical protein